ncbi:ExeM/NucH family extracellular endonuclease [Demequina sp. SYSU T00068]|uniref:ExeM/NucH family extracellular endonuclease n=1 Tax=Demequina lignilytica TaxID=3051663 RepID=UPI00263640F8|nr:ExeM/NucH family extracellular endonuclease [Demequina sp. SYSU T00068]MDN4490299.1 ExeM/NucH family extracellular endonuclease [Demequina sp. SYSU T00068]
MRRRITATALLGALAGSILVASPATADTPTDLFFSEYVEGSSGSNKAVEIFNGTGTDVDLAGYSVELYSNGRLESAGATSTLNLAGTVADGDVWVVANGSANPSILDVADVTSGVANFNGNDAVVLRHDGAIIDILGTLGDDTVWGADVSLQRGTTICTGSTTYVAGEWTDAGDMVHSGLGTHTTTCSGTVPVDAAPTVSSVSPVDGALGVPTTVAPVVTFSEPVAVNDAFTLMCGSDDLAVTVTGGPTEYTVTPDAALALGAECTLSVEPTKVEDLDGDADQMAAAFESTFSVTEGVIPIGQIQGDSDISPYAGQVVSFEGVVVADHEGASPALRGFFVQSRDGEGDGDAATSEGIFVFNAGADEVSLGDEVAVTGTVSEYFGQTQVSYADVEVLATGATVTPAALALPFDSADEPEAYEGMLVTFEETLTVTEIYLLGRFNEVTVSGAGRLDQPSAVVSPGEDVIALQAANDLNKIKVDDGFDAQNLDPMGRGGDPLSADNTLRGGDTISGLTGVLTYTWAGSSASGNTWRVRPAAEEFVFDATNPRPTEAPEVGGDITVASFNVLNYFLTIDEGSDVCGPVGYEQGCRGADSVLELERQTAKLVQALLALDADVIGIMEMENSPGVEPLAALAAAMNEELGAEVYDYVDTGVVGTDTIRVGFLYDATTVAEEGAFAVLDSSVDARFDDDRNRPSIAQSFVDGEGEVLTVVANHWKSKSCTEATGLDADQGDGASCWNATRTAGAEALVDWLGTDPTGVDDPDVIVMGDLNSYGMEDPIQVLRDAGYVELGGGDYSYVYDGQWGSLDYSFASASMAEQVTGSAHFHINADEPSVLDYNTDYQTAEQIESLYAADMYRTSDHDPVLIGLSLGDTEEPTGPSGVTFRDISGVTGAEDFTAFFDEITWMGAVGISTGWKKSDGTYVFRPLAQASREAVAAFLYRLAGSPEFTAPTTPTFTDVTTSNPFYTEIEWMAAEGITTGWADGTYRPKSSISRDAVVVFLYRYLGVSGYTGPSTPTFSDVQPGSTYYTEIEWAAAAGITTGWSDGTFRPTAKITRDAIAAFLYRVAHATI